MKRLTWMAAVVCGTVAARGVCEPVLGPAAISSVPSAALYGRYAVAADHPLASRAGAEVLAQGGNAVDAAAASAFALSVVRPFSCGVGGGGFMVVFLKSHPRLAVDPRGEFFALNYRETCPAGVGPDYFEGLGEGAGAAARFGGKAVAVPSSAVGLLAAQAEWGVLERAAVLAPAIRLAREGFAADAAYAKAASDTAKKFGNNPEWKARFAFAWTRYLHEGRVEVGDRIHVPEQAGALELLARDGAEAFTRGPIAEAMVRAVRADGGVLTAADLAGYTPARAAPLVFGFEGNEVATMPPPSSGGVALAQTLLFMEAAGLRRVLDAHPPEAGSFTPHYTHLLAEGFKHAFADRARYMADPAFAEIPLATLLAPETIAARAGRFSRSTTHGPEGYGTREEGAEPAEGVPEDGGTSHVSVVDAWGNAAACTETINLEFGSLLAVPEYGFLLNNQMDDFTTVRGRANAFGLVQSDKNLPEPGKRPLSSMTPTIVVKAGEDGARRVQVVAGASGGPRIITATTQAILNALVLGRGSGEAVALPRIHHQWMPNVLEIEAGYPGRHNGLETALWMRKLHHEVKNPTSGACVQMIQRVRTSKGEQWDAACDPRKGGGPAGE